MTLIAQAVVGGMIIGLAAGMLWMFHGRIAGISGVLNGVIDRRADKDWRLAFIVGLVGGGLLVGHFLPAAVPQALPGTGLLIGAGLLVGGSARLANGCTSGHGVCGVARLSPRSIVATLTLVGAGALTVFGMNFIGGIS